MKWLAQQGRGGRGGLVVSATAADPRGIAAGVRIVIVKVDGGDGGAATVGGGEVAKSSHNDLTKSFSFYQHLPIRLVEAARSRFVPFS